jgi:hypothetical protein
MTRNLTARTRRRGTILPLVVLTLVAMCGFVALGVDIGLIAVAKTQCQNAADAAAMAGSRSLDGTPTQNIGAVGTSNSAFNNAVVIAQGNPVLQTTLAYQDFSNTTLPPAGTGIVQVEFGSWHYDATSQLFTAVFPPPTGDNYNMCGVTVTFSVQTTFAAAFQAIDPSFNTVFTVTTTAQAAHRPRDISMVLDYSGSMNNESDLWNNESYLDNGKTNTTLGYTWPQPSDPDWTSNNMDTVYPLFGHYTGSSSTALSNNGNDYSDYTKNPNLLSPAASPSSPLYWNQAATSSSLIGKSNVTQSVLGIPAMVNDYFSNNRGATAVLAFSSASASYATTPNGDNYLPKSGTSTTPPTYATDVADIFGSTATNTTWETSGYKSRTKVNFNGFTQGPAYYGKTFFIWPPDPTNDWRKKFFFKSDAVTPLNDNTQYFQNSYPGYKDPAGNYVINYKAILNWIQNTGPNPFPSQLRGGEMIMYGSIPNDVPAAAYDHTQPNYNITNNDQRFWKEYIDWTLGVWRDPTGTVQHTQQPSCSIGPDFMFGTVQISAPPSTGTPPPYMNYSDNPWRPRHRMWFGPMTMVQFMMDCGYMHAATHDISMFPLKQGISVALTDIQNNHPNDLVSMVLFNRPLFNNDPKGCNGFSNPLFNLTNNYTAMLGTLWVPPGGATADVPIWDSNQNLTIVPRAFADFTANTTTIHGMMLTYNQFSGNTTVSTAGVGGLGRKGAARTVIFETDGMANENSIPQGGFVQVATPQSSIGAYNSYYAILPGDVVDGGGYNATQLLQVVQTICNLDSGAAYVTPYPNYPTGFSPPTNQGYPGYSTPNKPAQIYCIAFGAIFETPSSSLTSSVALLQQVAAIGNTTFPASSTDPTYGYLWCIGSLSQRQQKLEQACLNILDSSVPVSLIQ